MYVCVYMCVCVCTYIYIYIYVCCVYEQVRGTVGFSKAADALLIAGFLLVICMGMRIFNLAAKGTLTLIAKVFGALISPCRPCLNRCGRKMFGKVYDMQLYI